MTVDIERGILSDRQIRAAYDGGWIRAETPFDHDQVQPASLDLRLGTVAYRVRASFLPGPATTVADRISALRLHEIDLTDGAVLETGCVYIVPLLEGLDLPPEIEASANPKSSTGRLDIFTRVITDRARAFDTIPAGYRGPLYLEVSPRTFPILARTGSRLSQIRFRRGDTRLSDEALLDAIEAHPILLNRPLVVTPEGVRLCRPSERVLDLLPPQRGEFRKEDGELVVDSSGRVLAGA